MQLESDFRTIEGTVFFNPPQPLQALSSSRPAPRTTSTSSRLSSAWWTSSAKRCPRAWTPEILLSQGPSRGPSWRSSRPLLTRTVHVKDDSSPKQYPSPLPLPFLTLLKLEPSAPGPTFIDLFSNHVPSCFGDLAAIAHWGEPEPGWKGSEVFFVLFCFVLFCFLIAQVVFACGSTS